MRTNKTATIALAAALTLGAAGTATAALASDGPDQDVVTVPAHAPAAQQQVAQQVRILQRTEQAVKPVNNLLQAVLESENGRLSQTQAKQHGQAVERALDRLVRAVRDLQTDEAYQQSAQHNAGVFASPRLTAKAADQVQEHVDRLIKQARAGHQARVQRQAQAVVKGEVNLLTSVVLGGQLPAPDMQGLPEIQLPQNADQRPDRDQADTADLAPVG